MIVMCCHSIRFSAINNTFRNHVTMQCRLVGYVRLGPWQAIYAICGTCAAADDLYLLILCIEDCAALDSFQRAGKVSDRPGWSLTMRSRVITEIVDLIEFVLAQLQDLAELGAMTLWHMLQDIQRPTQRPDCHHVGMGVVVNAGRRYQASGTDASGRSSWANAICRIASLCCLTVRA